MRRKFREYHPQLPTRQIVGYPWFVDIRETQAFLRGQRCEAHAVNDQPIGRIHTHDSPAALQLPAVDGLCSRQAKPDARMLRELTQGLRRAVRLQIAW